MADRIGHRAEGADGRGLHDDADDAEGRVSRIVEKDAQPLGLLADRHQREAEEDGDEQHLQDLPLREGAEDGVRDHAEQKVDRATGLMRLLGVLLHRRGVGVARKARARAQQRADDEAENEREGRDGLEIDERLDADAPDLAGVGEMRDAAGHRAEDDRGDGHLDELHEAVAERFDPLRIGLLGEKGAKQRADRDRRERLHIELAMQGLLRVGQDRGSRAGGARPGIGGVSAGGKARLALDGFFL